MRTGNESVHSFLTEDLCLRRVFISDALEEAQKQLFMEFVLDMLDRTKHVPNFMKTIITGDETFVYNLCSMRSVILHERENVVRTARAYSIRNNWQRMWPSSAKIFLHTPLTQMMLPKQHWFLWENVKLYTFWTQLVHIY